MMTGVLVVSQSVQELLQHRFKVVDWMQDLYVGWWFVDDGCYYCYCCC